MNFLNFKNWLSNKKIKEKDQHTYYYNDICTCPCESCKKGNCKDCTCKDCVCEGCRCKERKPDYQTIDPRPPRPPSYFAMMKKLDNDNKSKANILKPKVLGDIDDDIITHSTRRVEEY